MKKTILLVVAVFLLSACATTGDPKDGGLFGWSESKAQDRLAEREARRNELQRQQKDETARKARLDTAVATKKSNRDALNRKLKAVDRENAALKGQIARYKAENSAQEAALADLRARQSALQKRAGSLHGDGGDIAAKEAEADQLRREVEELANDFNILSGQ